jgi:hypothetical protein
MVRPVRRETISKYDVPRDNKENGTKVVLLADIACCLLWAIASPLLRDVGETSASLKLRRTKLYGATSG